jgi:21S rRNA (uridine2791-2'-O)-methyltransferase
VAVEKTRPNGRVIGIDLIPAQPPRGVASFQGDFLSPTVQKLVKDYIRNSSRSRATRPQRGRMEYEGGAVSEDPSSLVRPTYIEMERNITLQREDPTDDDVAASASHCVDVC